MEICVKVYLVKLKGVMYILLFYLMMISLYIYLKVLIVMIRLPRPALIF
jgi:hypothetical protein